MTKTLAFILFVLYLTYQGNAQNMRARTNSYRIDLEGGNKITNSGILPKIEWISPVHDFSSSEKNRIEIQAFITLPQPVKSVFLIVGNSQNHSQIWFTKRVDINDSLTQYELKLPVNLPDGGNYVKIEIVTAENYVISERRNILIGSAAVESTLSLDRKDYALIFATDKYDHWSDLVNPIDDAHAIARELKEKYGFIVDIIENPNVEDVWTKLREYSELKFGKQDQLLIFFAGHGHYDDTFGEGYVVAKNSLNNDPSRNSYISHNRLRGVVNNIPCNHTLLTMDVCFGGTLDPVLARKRGEKEEKQNVNEFLVRKFGYKTRKYLTSGGKEYVSDGVPGKHSPFAEKFIESLQSRGGNDYILTLAEIQVSLEKLNQLPRFGSFGEDESLGDFIFIVKQN